MKLPPEIIVELRTLAECIPDGVGFSVTLNTDGGKQWSVETKHVKRILLSTGMVHATTGHYGTARIGR